MSKEKENKSIIVEVIRSPLDRSKRTIETISYDGETVYELVKEHIPEQVQDIVVSINGKIIKEENWDKTYLVRNEQLVIIPILADSEIIQIVALVALFVFAPHIAVALAPGLAGTAVALTTFGSFLTAAVMIGGGMLINSLGPKPSVPQLGGFGETSEISQFFSFSPATKQRQGLVIPRIFGKLKLFGNVIAANTELNETNDKQILNLLIALCKGPIKGIVGFADPSIFGEIKLNDQPIENFIDVNVEHRLGTLNQDIITYFDDTVIENIRETLIPSSGPITFTTTGSNFDEIEVKIGAPQGIWFQDDNNVLVNHNVGIKIEISKASADVFSTLFEGDITDNRNSLVKRTYRTLDNNNVTIENGFNYDVKVTKTTEDQTEIRYGDTINLSSVSTVITDDFIYPTVSLVGLKALASDQLSGSLKFSCIAEGNICRVVTDGDFVNEWSDNPAWVLYTILSSPVFSGESEGNYIVERYDGVSPAQLDTDAFIELAAFCDDLIPASEDDPSTLEKRFIFNGGFDTASSVWESALVVCRMCRCGLVFNGTTISVVIDRPTEVSQMFGMGNVIAGSFKQNFPPQNERASEIEINFLDEEQDYRKTPFTIFNTAILNDSNKVTINLVGCTRKTQAWREGEFVLRQNQFILQSIEFATGIDSLACQVGDVIEFSSDVPKWDLQSGRVVGVGSNTITLSEDFVDDDPSVSEDYKILIRLDDDVLLTKSIFSFDGNLVTLTEPLDPSLEGEINIDDIYQIGTSVNINNQFRVTQIIRSSEQNAQIRAIQYDERIYDGDDLGAELPTEATFAINVDDRFVTNLRLSEDVKITESGVIQRDIIIAYDLPVSGSFLNTQIYVRVQDTTWEKRGTTTLNTFVIPGVLATTSYEVKVVTQLNDLTTTPFDSSPSGFITTGSNSDFKDQILKVIVTGLQVDGGSITEWVGRDVALVWDELPEANINPSIEDNPSFEFWPTIPTNFIADYEVKIYTFGGNLRRTEFVLEPRYTYTFENNFEDGSGNPSRDLRIEVKVRDKFGRLAEEPAILPSISNPAPQIPANITLRAISRGFELRWDAVGEIDISGYKVFASTTSPVTVADDTNLVWDGQAIKMEYFPDTLTTWFVKLVAYDTFFIGTGTTGLNVSTQQSVAVTDSASISLNIPTYDMIFNDDNPSATTPHWTAGTLLFEGVSYDIPAGEAEAGDNYIYWEEGDEFLSTTQSVEVAVDIFKWLIGFLDGGEFFQANQSKIFHAGLMQADTITANLIKADQINTNHLQANVITTDKIITDAITADKIIANAITTNKINADAITADKMAANSITAANGAIANLTIDTAQIATAAIESAKIGNLEVDTINIANEAVTIQESANFLSTTNLTTSHVTYALDTIESVGGTVTVTFSASFDSGSTRSIEIKLFEAGSNFRTESLQVTSSSDINWSVTIPRVPGAGSKEYAIQAKADSTTGTPRIKQKFVILTEVKK